MYAFRVLFSDLEHFLGVQEKDKSVKSGDGIAEDYHRGTHRGLTRTEQASKRRKRSRRNRVCVAQRRREGERESCGEACRCCTFL